MTATRFYVKSVPRLYQSSGDTRGDPTVSTEKSAERQHIGGLRIPCLKDGRQKKKPRDSHHDHTGSNRSPPLQVGGHGEKRAQNSGADREDGTKIPCLEGDNHTYPFDASSMSTPMPSSEWKCCFIRRTSTHGTATSSPPLSFPYFFERVCSDIAPSLEIGQCCQAMTGT